MKEVYDIGIIGAGPAGLFAAYRAAETDEKKSVVVFELGKRFLKRRRFLEGAFGSMMFSDGKLYPDDYLKVSAIADGRKVRSATTWVESKFEKCGSLKITKNKEPSQTVKNKAAKLGLNLTVHDYVQWKQESFHKLSRMFSDYFDDVKNVDLEFENEVYSISKLENGNFQLSTSNGEFFCKKILLCAGRSGWRWVSDIYKSLNIKTENDTAKFGVTIEMPDSFMKEFNKSHCSFYRDDLMIGHLNWNGTIIPEDHADLVVSTFRSNEERWKTQKVCFQVISPINVGEDKGVSETDRLSKLAFLLLNDRVAKDKVKNLVRKKTALAQLPEYDLITSKIKELETLFPNIILKGSFYAPTIWPATSKINIKQTMETDVDGFFVAGESANIFGIYAAAISGVVAIDNMLKG